jgi:SAM-dependent methyltransferase
VAGGLARVLEPETLDHLAPDDPRAVRSRRDLVRINAIMGARRVLRRAIGRACPAFGARPLRVVEIGCGDGLLLLDLARRMPAGAAPVELVLLDRAPIVEPATLAAYAAAGWRAAPRTADAMDWADGGPVDLVVANLFLHHLEPDALARLFADAARRGTAIAAVEPRRSRFALLFAHLVAFVGANDVTRRDAVLSVRAGFRGAELASLWPAAEPRRYRLDEREDGPFSHAFAARPLDGPAP